MGLHGIRGFGLGVLDLVWACSVQGLGGPRGLWFEGFGAYGSDIRHYCSVGLLNITTNQNLS